ncbi:Eco57I restriction-modification methylase domain-containing protein [Bacillus cereus]|uniref:Eco57I restriction-modification methylase domain-containing protein n=1 Tax=Bacillus cereus TaxID=1396 RepID=UPI00061DF1DE|nr:N-6 DNA methylase [Bacillus cereus]AKE15347.1 putative type IIS restriction /modification enzyme, N-terminal half [Bacillus cereus]
MNKEDAKSRIQELVTHFEKYENTYTAPGYKEAEVRAHFLDEFFSALGWDIHPKGYQHPLDLEVVIEQSLDSEKNTKFIDYVFKINRKTQFLVEAKKPSENLSKPAHIFQAKSYAFTTEIPFVILTNFKEFRFYDVSTEPLFNQPETDKVTEYCFNYKEYINNFDLIWNLFSRESVANKSLAKFYANRRGLEYSSDQVFNLNYQVTKGSSLLDIAFLRDLKNWRKELAESLLENNNLSISAISEVVQRFLDRLIFIRIIEDREIEQKEYLKEIIEKYEADKSLSLKDEIDALCNNLNTKFNGLIFHNHTLTNEATIGNEVLEKIIKNLYYPSSPYNFKLIKPEILGRIFEQFLGEKLTIKEGKIIVELKEANKKAGGVFYTPSYIVDSIVGKTLEKKLSNFTTIEDLGNLKIADIACGSGSFLIGAYKYLIKYYESYYSQLDMDLIEYYKSKNLIFEDNNRIILTMEYKKTILQQSIFGVDIDAQAIEVAKLSLYITMLEEGYREDSLRPILPDLNDNIKHGNSLINSDLYLDADFDFDENLIKPFDWEYAFSDILDNGGFDVIIGNPPYIRIQIFEELYGKNIVKFIKEKYTSAEKFNFDIYVVFIEKGINLLKNDGILGYIVMNKFFITQYGENLRKLITEQQILSEITDFGINEIFDKVTTYTCILILDNSKPTDVKVQIVENLENWQIGNENNYSSVPQAYFGASPWYLTTNTEDAIFGHFEANCELLKDIADRVFVGVQTDCDEVFILTEDHVENDYIYCKSEYTNEIHKFETSHLKPFLKGSLDIKKYRFSNNNKWLIFPYLNEDGKSNLITKEEYEQEYPYTWHYLELCQERLSKRKAVKTQLDLDPSYNEWYKYIYKKNHTRLEQQKIVFPAISKESSFNYDRNGNFYFVGSGAGGGGGGAITLPTNSVYDYYSLLGILNSEVVSFQIIKRGSKHKGNFFGVDKSRIEGLYLPKITAGNESKLKDVSRLVRHIERAHTQINQSQLTDTEITQSHQRIGMLAQRINSIVYEIYELPQNSIEYIKSTLEN